MGLLKSASENNLHNREKNIQSSDARRFSSDHIESISSSTSKIILLEIANEKLNEEVVKHQNDLKYVWNCLATQSGTIAKMQAQIDVLLEGEHKTITSEAKNGAKNDAKNSAKNVAKLSVDNGSEKADFSSKKASVKQEHSNESIVEFSD